jgi:hypothetical protein
MRREIGHLAARNPRRTFDQVRAAVLADDQLREGDPVLQPERVHRRDRDLLRLRERIGEQARGVDVDPSDAEADARRPQPVGQRQRRHAAASRDHEAVQLEAFVVALENRLFRGRLGERRVQVGVEVVPRLDPEDAALAAGVGRLHHGGKPNRVERGVGLVDRPNGRVAGLRHACIGEPRSHRDLVGHQVRRLGADPGQAETLGDRRDDGNGAVGGDGQDAVDGVAAPGLCDGVHVREVDDLADVGLAKPQRVRVPVDADDAQPELTSLPDRPLLVAARADEENRPVHPGARC